VDRHDPRGLHTLFRRLPLLVTAAILGGSALSPAGQTSRVVSIADHRILGDRNANVTVIEFGDYQCAFCRRFWRETLPRIRREYIDTGKVRLVYWDFPQSVHPEAVIAARAAECAADRSKYWEYHDKVFREQDKRGSDVVRFKAKDLKRWATEIGLEATPFNECLDSARHEDEVAVNHAHGAEVGVDGTPTFFINGTRLVGAQPFAVFQKVIEAELSRQKN